MNVTCPSRICIVDSGSMILSKAGCRAGYWICKSVFNTVSIAYSEGAEVGDIYSHCERVIGVFVGVHTIEIVNLNKNTWALIVPKNAPKLSVWTLKGGFVQI